tara:strand:- start:463 stop:597 length:135 start_codon:yes stop_codon:yes gene_type:complete
MVVQELKNDPVIKIAKSSFRVFIRLPFNGYAYEYSKCVPKNNPF